MPGSYTKGLKDVQIAEGRLDTDNGCSDPPLFSMITLVWAGLLPLPLGVGMAIGYQLYDEWWSERRARAKAEAEAEEIISGGRLANREMASAMSEA